MTNAGWLRVLRNGTLLYLAGGVILLLSGNPNLLPTVMMLGSFVIPAAYVAFFYENRHLSSLTIATTAQSFIYGGVLGILAAGLLEPIFVLNLPVLTSFEVGFIEEFAKILGVLFIARRRRHDSEMDGLILGAAAGMGFAALESSGYAFTAFLRSGGNPDLTFGVMAMRGLLSPLGHGTWTAILASVLFRESTKGHYHINLKVIGAYVTVSVLHALWDILPPFISKAVGSGVDVFLVETVIGAAGLYILRLRWLEARRRQEEGHLLNPKDPDDFPPI